MVRHMTITTIPFLIIVGASLFLLAFICGLYSIVIGGLLSSYLKKHRYDRWRSITTIDTFLGKFGPGARDSRQISRYVYSDEDDDDEQIKRLKDKIRISLRYVKIFFASSLVTFSLIVIIIYSSRK
jgi:hypothetical protein